MSLLHDRSMDSQRNTHVPLAQLSIADLFLYFTAASKAIAPLNPRSPTEKERRKHCSAIHAQM
jgi:hypothetical protein